MEKIRLPEELEQYARTRRAELQKFTTTVSVCAGTGCQASGCLPVLEALRTELEKRDLAGEVRLRATGCHGFCEQGPLMVIEPGNIFYCHLTPEAIPQIVEKTIMQRQILEEWQYADPVTGRKIAREEDIPFYKAQDRAILSQNKLLDPTDIDDYVAQGGYAAFAKALTRFAPGQVIDEIKQSGLRGRGGAGFSSGAKWEECARASGNVKYVVCNADEGDPGAYMDRSVLEGNPHAVLEGMLIAAYAVGASQGYIYVRNEYPLAVKHARLAVESARQLGLLGSDILGSGFSFDVDISRGGGAFVCGESSALMRSLSGQVGEPVPKDVHATERGFKGLPTLLNNVETLANVPAIIAKGSAWFAAKGTPQSKGTKIFALTGQIRNTGLIEVAMGTPLTRIIEDIGGGALKGASIKAVQTGGPSGGCLPADRFELPVDFEALAEAGSMVGSGGMVVMDERSCMVDVARYFLAFLLDESCGKCVPCRLGIDRMLEIVTDITEGRGSEEQLALLEELAETVAIGSLCALGKTAPNPVLSTLRYFRSEYEAHIRDKKCPAGVCRALIRYVIDPEKCTGCGLCLKACPHGAISGERKEAHLIDDAACARCGICREQCAFGAVIIQ
jgi:NADH:ubiquinone oxidoreductase subunit F (NADH-binding)/NAD-dependent dihydropyrimidine dehydrogenase PreA subunit/(2Fe-2S) ferredoxin